jgi:hypothetical protein
MNTSKRVVPATRCWFQQRENQFLTLNPDTCNRNTAVIDVRHIFLVLDMNQPVRN